MTWRWVSGFTPWRGAGAVELKSRLRAAGRGTWASTDFMLHPQTRTDCNFWEMPQKAGCTCFLGPSGAPGGRFGVWRGFCDVSMFTDLGILLGARKLDTTITKFDDEILSHN